MWWQQAVTYQLYVRSFADSDGDGIGDLDGIRQHLDHIAALGVDAIWLNPCYPSPQLDHGYDVSDYLDINPEYGTLETFDALIAEAGERDIRVLMDVVPNHCSSAHPWFQAALAAPPGSAERNRFWFRDGRGPAGTEPPNDWQAIFGGSAWTQVEEADGTPGQWYLGVFTPHQPDLNWHDEEVAAHFDEVLRFWFDRGVAGFRADAITVVGKAEGLPDHGGPIPFGQASPHFNHQVDGLQVWKRWRRLVEDYNAANPGRDVYLIGEAYTEGRPDLMARYANADAFHQIFSFDLMLAPWRADAIRAAAERGLAAVASDAPPPAWTLNNHDTERIVSRLGRSTSTDPRDPADGNLRYPDDPVDVGLGQRRSLALTAFVLALPGSVFLYMGEEKGLPEVTDIPDDRREDPLFAQTDGELRGRDGCRVPLPWTDDPTTAYGFSIAGGEGPWLPQPSGWGRYADGGEVQPMLRQMLRVRRETAVQQPVEVEWLHLGEGGDGLVVFRRGRLVVALNTSDGGVQIPADLVQETRCVLRSLAPASDAASQLDGNSCAWWMITDRT